MSRAAVGLNVFQPQQPLLDETEQVGKAFADAAPQADNVVLNGLQEEQNQAGIEQPNPAGQPGFAQEQQQDAQDEQSVAQHLHYQLGKVLGQVVDVAVNPFNQFAGRLELVKAHVQADDVAGQVYAQPVGGRPAQVFTHVGAEQGQPFLADGDGEVENGR